MVTLCLVRMLTLLAWTRILTGVLRGLNSIARSDRQLPVPGTVTKLPKWFLSGPKSVRMMLSVTQ